MAKWSRAKGVGWQTFEGAAVLLDPSRNLVHELNATATFLWERLDGVSESELAEGLVESFAVPPARAQADALVFLDRLKELGLVEPQ